MKNMNDPDSMIYGDDTEYPPITYSGTNTEPIKVKEKKRAPFKFKNDKPNIRIKNIKLYDKKGKLIKITRKITNW